MTHNAVEGNSYKCSQSSLSVYRYTEGELRHYLGPEIASSWDPNWRTNYSVIACDGIPRGFPMTYNAVEGNSYKCSTSSSKVYRYTEGELRWYPNPVIASSWDPNWRTNYSVIACDGILRGFPMTYNSAAVSSKFLHNSTRVGLISSNCPHLLH